MQAFKPATEITLTGAENMKKKYIVTISAIIVLIAVLAALGGCDGDSLFRSSWEAAVIRNAQGQIIACGEDYAYNEDIGVETVTCTVSADGEISIRWVERLLYLTGKMTEVSEGADKSVRYSIEFSDGSTGTATYIAEKDAVYPSDQDKDDGCDLPESYELTLTIEEEYTFYFVRVAQIK